ncbi:MAG: Omp28-related outer membrane protein [Ignavibacteriaceae bacterium]
MKKLLLLFIPLLLWSCETNPPITPINPIVEYGTIQVLSNVADAKIFIDGNDTGKLSPDTVTTTTGNHIIELRKDGYDVAKQNIIVIKNQSTEIGFKLLATDKIVLIEDFANVSCVPCVTSNKILEQLTNHTFGRNKLIAIKYPTNFPSPVDPFFLANGPDCNARMSYYSIILAPTNIVGGQLRPIPSDSNDVKEKIYSELSEIPQFIVDVQSTISSNNYNINISVEVKNVSNLDFSKLVLHTVVTETDIEFATPPGSNGETKFYDVMRKMLPDNQGELLTSINQIGTYNFQRQVPINSGWMQNKLNTVVFIQNKETKEIYQAGSTF